MLTYDDALNLDYYKKTSFTGWTGKMRFKIERVEPVIKEATETEPAQKGPAEFHVCLWPAPYIYDLTEDTLKIRATFPFTIEGRNQAVDWINEQAEKVFNK